MIVLDFFIVNVALPSIRLDLHASPSAIEWVVAGYGLTFASCLITAGRCGDQIGRRRAFSIGLGLFTAASVACGLAPNPGFLIGGGSSRSGRRSAWLVAASELTTMWRDRAGLHRDLPR
jgi:MFS family permease